MTTTQQPHAQAQVELCCPYCNHSIDPLGVPLIEGSDLPCPHCGEECVLEREWLGHGGHSRWILVENGDDDEP